MYKLLKLIVLGVLFITTLNSAFSTDFGLNLSGERKFKLNHNVGPNELRFNSSAPLEDIVGYVDKDAMSSSVTLDPANIEKATGTVVFKVNGMETGIKTRDEHLHGPNWLDAAQFPEIKFELRNIKDVKIVQKDPPLGRASAEATAVGVFTMRGISKNITSKVKITFVKESDFTKKRANGDLLFVEGTFSIKLADFNVQGTKGVIGSKVGKEISITYKLFYNAG
ncbi:MAG: YceI family protein [Candidatus Kapabacteria bacterium]|nr:YceI family protein [Candidatus Kapabacteria bacterium]